MYIKKGASILLVEDEAPLREVMAEELRDMGYHVQEAENGVKAVVALSQDFDLLLTDIRMAGNVSGWDLAEAARRIQPEIEVIYMSGYSAEQPKRVENSVFLTKPCTINQILSMMTCCSGEQGQGACST
jgi:CheY-like chemotaxis protein